MTASRWPLIGMQPSYESRNWPMPWFLKIDPLLDETSKVRVSAHSVFDAEEEIEVEHGCEDYPEMGVCGEEVVIHRVREMIKKLAS